MIRTVYSIGYENLEPATLKHLATATDSTVVDVRASPRSRRRGFGRRQLEALLGDRYAARPDLGNHARTGLTWDGGIDWLLRMPRDVILLCREASPGDCHRHALMLEIDARRRQRKLPPIDLAHIYEDHLVLIADLEQAIRDDVDDYPATDLRAFLRRLAS